MAYHLTPDLPTSFPVEAVNVFVEKVRGVGDHDTACCLQAGWIVAGYALRQFSPEPHLKGAATPTPDDLADTLDELKHGALKGAGVDLAGFSWETLAVAILEVLKQWLLQPKS